MNVAIAGYGVEGRASYEYYRAQGHDVTVVDERENLGDIGEIATILGADAFSKLNEFELIIRSPSINPKKLPYGEKVWSATNEFFAKCPAPIIGVTGTKGKGTTSSFIASILNAAGRTVHLVGNIGTPAITELKNIQPEDVVVYELSSFQLWDAKRSPHVSVVLMIEADHLDVHDSFKDYIEAKRNIVRFQSEEDITIFYKDSEYATNIGLSSVAGKVVAYPDEEALERYAPYVSLPGTHNLENAYAAVLAANSIQHIDESSIEKGLSSFTGLPHRLKLVAEKDGVTFYDDSIATTPGSAIAAIRSFGQPKVIILGGQDKGADYTELIELCAETDTKVVAMGAIGSAIEELCTQLGVTCERADGPMNEVVTLAHQTASVGDVVILSPAAASFDMFKSYADRGDQFIAAVNDL
jgi:UDP-N-acetylmuramoylalanine--D-glutamate ligase